MDEGDHRLRESRVYDMSRTYGGLYAWKLSDVYGQEIRGGARQLSRNTPLRLAHTGRTVNGIRARPGSNFYRRRARRPRALSRTEGRKGNEEKRKRRVSA